QSTAVEARESSGVRRSDEGRSTMTERALGDSPPVDPTFERLKAWRDREVLESRIQLGEIKDTYLRAVARSGRRRADEIAGMLPAALRKYAPELERLVNAGTPHQSGPAPQPVQPTQPVQPSQPADRVDHRLPTPAAPTSAAGPESTGRPVPPPPAGADPGAPAEPESPRPVDPARSPADPPQSTPPPSTPSTSGPPVPPRPSSPGTAAPGPGGAASPPPPAERSVPRRAVAGPGFDPAALSFAPYAFGAEDFTDLGGPSPVSLRSATQPDGVRLIWNRPEGLSTATVYRVVASDEQRPYSPDRADLVAVVPDDGTGPTLTALDQRPFTAAIRHYQLWCNTGPSPEAAARDQPRLIGEKAVVSQVLDVELREDEGR